MRLVFIGLSLSSSWGNTQATAYRALLKGLAQRGHEILFLERDQPWHAANRDLAKPNFCRLRLYHSVSDLWSYAADVADADAVIIGSHVPDAANVIAWAASARHGALCFYDFNTEMTLRHLAAGALDAMLPSLIPLFDVYFSSTGGEVLEQLQRTYAASQPVALYASVDADIARQASVPNRWDLGYIGSDDPSHRDALERLLLEPARRAPDRRFVVAGGAKNVGRPIGAPNNGKEIVWPDNVERIQHLPPGSHATFYAACGWTLNLASHDHTPASPLFEATACGSSVITNAWRGISDVLEPRREIMVANTADEVLSALSMQDEHRREIGRAARRRALRHHTGLHRATELEAWLQAAKTRPAVDWVAPPSRVPELADVDLAL
jgi:spore maturation protein CgeB